MVRDTTKMTYVQIELEAVQRVCQGVVDFTKQVEGDGHLVFTTYALWLKMSKGFSDGKFALGRFPFLEKVVKAAVASAAKQIPTQARAAALQATQSKAGKLVAARDAVAAGAVIVSAAVAVAEDAAQFEGGVGVAVGARPADAGLVRQVLKVVAATRDLEAAEKKLLAAQMSAPPGSVSAWEAHIKAGMQPMMDYLLRQISPGGDRREAFALFYGSGYFVVCMWC